MSDSDNTQAFAALAKGTEVNHYRIIEKIGAGGMGEVYLADDTKLNRRVALKFLPHQLASDNQIRLRFTREAQAVAKLNHPNVVTIFEVAEFKGRPFFATEYVSGKSLREVIKQDKLSLDDALDITAQLCEGLTEAHAAGIVHRDIKPGNIVVDDKGRVRLLDFGLAHVAGEDKLTKTGSTLGTVGYMAPEQVAGKTADARSDLFSVGVVLYEMVSGRRPFRGDTDAAVLHAITHTDPDPIARFKSGTTAELQHIIEKALAKDPSLRYQHADGMLTDLKRLQSDRVPARPKSRWPMLIAAAVAVFAVGYIAVSSILKPQTPTDSRKRLVVLPFDNQGGADQDYFASGMTDEVISRLSSISGLSIVSRISAAKMKEAGEDIKDIGKELGAEYVLDASAHYQLGSNGTKRVRLVTQLINVAEDRVVWSQTYDTVMTEVFTVQSEIAEKVADEMNVVLLGRDKKAVWKKWTESEEAWDYYRQGRAEAQRNLFDKQQLLRAINLYRKAIEIDSNFVWPYVYLADMYGRKYAFQSGMADSFKTLTLWAAKKSAELSNDVYIVNWPMARYYYLCEKDYAKSIEYFERAFKGDKQNSGYLQMTHHCLRRMGRWEEAYERMRQVVELEPKWAVSKIDLATDCLYMRKYEEAVHWCREAIKQSPGVWNYYLELAATLVKWKGDIVAARQVMEESRGLIDSTRWKFQRIRWDVLEGNLSSVRSYLSMPYLDSATYFSDMAWVYRIEGNISAAHAYADSLLPFSRRNVEQHPDWYGSHTQLASSYALLGNRADAVREGEEAMKILPLSRDAVDGSQPLRAMINVYWSLGDFDKAVAYLDTTMSVPGEFGLGDFLVDPDYRELVRTDGFRGIMEEYADTAQWRLYKEKVGEL